MNSTVNINTDAGDFGADFVYEDVYIITNYHVVYNAKDIKVVTYNKEEYKGSLVGYDSENDIAVLKINKKLKSMVLGDSEKVKTGDTLTAIGNSNGDLSKYGYDKLCLIIPINNVKPIISNIIENS